MTKKTSHGIIKSLIIVLVLILVFGIQVALLVTVKIVPEIERKRKEGLSVEEKMLEYLNSQYRDDSFTRIGEVEIIEERYGEYLIRSYTPVRAKFESVNYPGCEVTCIRQGTDQFSDNYMFDAYKPQLQKDILDMSETIFTAPVDVWIDGDKIFSCVSKGDGIDYESYVVNSEKALYDVYVVLGNESDVDGLNEISRLSAVLKQNGYKCNLHLTRRNIPLDEYDELYKDFRSHDKAKNFDELYFEFEGEVKGHWGPVVLSKEIRDKYLVVEKNPEYDVILVKDEQNKCGAIDYSGNSILPCIYDTIGIHGKFITVNSDDIGNAYNYSIMNRIMSNEKYSSVQVYDKYLYVYRNTGEIGGVCGLCDTEFNIVLPCEYDAIKIYGDAIKAKRENDDVEFYDDEMNLLKVEKYNSDEW